MEKILQKAGLGQEAADAIAQSGLGDFMQGRDVFERLYRDALNRMRRLAEAQARVFEQSSDEFMRVIKAVLEPLRQECNIRQDKPQLKDRPAAVFSPRSAIIAEHGTF